MVLWAASPLVQERCVRLALALCSMRRYLGFQCYFYSYLYKKDNRGVLDLLRPAEIRPLRADHVNACVATSFHSTNFFFFFFYQPFIIYIASFGKYPNLLYLTHWLVLETFTFVEESMGSISIVPLGGILISSVFK